MLVCVIFANRVLRETPYPTLPWQTHPHEAVLRDFLGSEGPSDDTQDAVPRQVRSPSNAGQIDGVPRMYAVTGLGKVFEGQGE